MNCFNAKTAEDWEIALVCYENGGRTRRKLWITFHSRSCGGWALPKRSPTTGIFAPPVLKTCFETARASFYFYNTKAEVDRFV